MMMMIRRQVHITLRGRRWGEGAKANKRRGAEYLAAGELEGADCGHLPGIVYLNHNHV